MKFIDDDKWLGEPIQVVSEEQFRDEFSRQFLSYIHSGAQTIQVSQNRRARVEIFLMRFEEEISVMEVSRRLGKSYHSTMKRYQAFIKDLRNKVMARIPQGSSRVTFKDITALIKSIYSGENKHIINHSREEIASAYKVLLEASNAGDIPPIPKSWSTSMENLFSMAKPEENVLAMSVQELDLSMRTKLCIRSLGAQTIRDLTKYSAKELLCQHTFGEKSLSELLNELNRIGVALKH